MANGLLLLLAILTIMSFAHFISIIDQADAVYITMGLYTIAAGFFGGAGYKLMRLNRKSGPLKYMHQSFWSRVAPNMMIILVVTFGIYKTGLFTWDFSGIGITSGTSLICFGFWGWTINIVPQFRSDKILLLDQDIDWDDVASYKWETEESLQIDYYNKAGLLTDFTTYIPPEDQLTMERLLSEKIKNKDSETED